MDAALLSPMTVDVLDDYDLSLDDVGAIIQKNPRTARRWVEVGRKDRGRLPAAQTVHGLRVRSADLAEYVRPIKSGLQPNPAAVYDALEVVEDDDAVIARVVATFPPLTPEQRERLAVILGGV
jgi:hypothetical protein